MKIQESLIVIIFCLFFWIAGLFVGWGFFSEAPAFELITTQEHIRRTQQYLIDDGCNPVLMPDGTYEILTPDGYWEDITDAAFGHKMAEGSYGE